MENRLRFTNNLGEKFYENQFQDIVYFWIGKYRNGKHIGWKENKTSLGELANHFDWFEMSKEDIDNSEEDGSSAWSQISRTPDNAMLLLADLIRKLRTMDIKIHYKLD